MNSRLSFLSVSLFFFLRQFSQLVPFLNCAVECWVEFKACKWSFCSCILFCKPPLVIEALNCHMAKFSIHSKFGFESCNTHVHSNCNSKWSLHSLESIADFKRVVTDIFWQWLMVYPSTLKSPHNSLEFCSFSVSRFHALALFECPFFHPSIIPIFLTPFQSSRTTTHRHERFSQRCSRTKSSCLGPLTQTKSSSVETRMALLKLQARILLSNLVQIPQNLLTPFQTRRSEVPRISSQQEKCRFQSSHS
jgi:hypothetical protein